MKIEILDGPRKGTIGWCNPDFVITSLRTSAERDAVEVEESWRLGQFLEGQGDLKLALSTYNGIVKTFAGTSRAKQAEERIKALQGKPKSR